MFSIIPFISSTADNGLYWELQSDGSIAWRNMQKLPHYDHIEMSGKRMSVVLRYGVDSNGSFVISKSMVWPMLRTIPNDTHASLMRHYKWNALDLVTINGRPMSGEKIKQLSLKGILTVESEFAQNNNTQWTLKREFLPSTEKPALVEIYTLVNRGKSNLSVELPQCKNTISTDPKKGVYGTYHIETGTDKNGCFNIVSGDSLSFTAYILAYKDGESCPVINGQEEKLKREKLVSYWMNNLVLETPDEVINRMFAFSKIRACESIYETKGGPMHGPGGESYYAALWANDQGEYVSPYFPFIGYEYGNASAFNAYKHFARFMNDAWKPIPSSIIAEGIDIWNGAGDRGDAAMIGYGASRYVLAKGDKIEAERLWPLIEWCLEYCHKKINTGGVVSSNADELEHRFPSGDANLCTSSLYYDALLSAAYLSDELGKGKARTYREQAKELRKNIESYFGAKVEGFDTYAYYKGNDILRAWICIPLTVGIYERAEGTIKALFSPRLWTENGLLTQAGSQTFWDRSTLYALRGVYNVGKSALATDYLHFYSTRRLLGDHVPYAIEAWPEGGQRHLSAESGLYGRIITEGLFGIRTTGFHSFTLKPQLPPTWNVMKLKKIHIANSLFDIEVYRVNHKMKVKVISNGKTQTKTCRANDNISFRM
jgi:hypothetical protein